MNKRKKLISLMAEYNLKAKDVAEMLGVDANTCRIWRSVSPKNIPDKKLELLELKLK